MIGGQRIDSGLDIGEVLLEQLRHVSEQPATLGHGPIGLRLRSCRIAVALARPPRQPPHDLAMTDVPGDARKLRGPIGEAGGELRNRADHALPPGWSSA